MGGKEESVVKANDSPETDKIPTCLLPPPAVSTAGPFYHPTTTKMDDIQILRVSFFSKLICRYQVGALLFFNIHCILEERVNYSDCYSV